MRRGRGRLDRSSASPRWDSSDCPEHRARHPGSGRSQYAIHGGVEDRRESVPLGPPTIVGEQLRASPAAPASWEWWMGQGPCLPIRVQHPPATNAMLGSDEAEGPQRDPSEQVLWWDRVAQPPTRMLRRVGDNSPHAQSETGLLWRAGMIVQDQGIRHLGRQLRGLGRRIAGIRASSTSQRLRRAPL